jgi:phenylalanyl-tRNA synthetase alpha chain
MTSRDEVKQRLEEARSQGLKKIAEATDMASLDEAKIRVLGRKAPLSEARSGLREVPDEDRKSVGALANEVQQELEAAIEAQRERFEEAELSARWERERIDVTLPGTTVPPGAVHILTQVLWQIVDIFVGLGYRVAEGPDVELSRYNFDALNTPYEHPSRSPLDTFYIAGKDEKVCLRTQTSPMQVRVMEKQQPPVYVVVPGRCYRRDTIDATHLQQFFQLEGLAVDEGITMSDLKGTLETFARELFGGSLEVRLRPHFFPFTEPSAEMDVQCFLCKGSDPKCRLCKGEGWVEILGCGMVDPNVLAGVGYDNERYTGFAFGMGIERIATLAYGVGDLRAFYENDLRFLGQFGGIA